MIRGQHNGGARSGVTLFIGATVIRRAFLTFSIAIDTAEAAATNSSSHASTCCAAPVNFTVGLHRNAT